MERERIALYDNIRAVLIILVVVGHFVDGLTAGSAAFRSLFLFIYTFHMPLFLFLSGLFQKDSGALSRAFGLVCVGFAVKITVSLVQLLIGWSAGFSLLSDAGISWFPFTLAVYTVAGQVLRRVDKRFLLALSLALGCFVGYDGTIGDYLYLSRTVVFYPFFVLGQMCSRDRLARISRRPELRLGGLAVLVLWAGLCWFARERTYVLRGLFTGRNPFGTAFYPWGAAWRALCYGISAATGAALICVTPSRRLPVLSAYGARTLQVYYWHLPVQELLQYLGVGALCASRPGKVLWLACAVGVALLTGTKPFSFPVRQILRWARPAEDRVQTEKTASPR